MLDGLEKRLGVPPLKEILSLSTGSVGKRIESILSNLEKLSGDKTTIKEVITLLNLVKELDEQGTLGRLLELLKELKPLTKGKTAVALVGKLDQLEKVIRVLLKEE